jgi:Zn-dependent protease with chaperone function
MLEAAYFDGRSARRAEVRLSIRDGRLHLVGATVQRTDLLGDIDFGEPLAGAPRCIEFRDGARCEVADEAALSRLLGEVGIGESLVVRLQRRWRWAVLSLIVLVTMFGAAYTWGLPALAKGLAPHVPGAVVRQISDLALAQAEQSLLSVSKVPAARQAQIRLLASERLSGAALPDWRLHFRESRPMGANAFALPAGDVVLLDGLVEKLSDDEVVAVLAHELGHVARHHGMQHLIESAVVSVVMAAWFNDVSSAAASAGALLVMSGYSREAEAEADSFAARQLLRCCGSAEALARALGKLQEGAANAAELLSTHPDTVRRIAAIRELKP